MDEGSLRTFLAAFPAEDIEWRIGESGTGSNGVWAKCFAYVTNRAIMKRLDEVAGPGNWQSKFEEIDGGFLCGIGVKIGGEWVWKWDGADRPDFEPLKGGLSGSMKRAAVQWGIGRYLYDLDTGWAEVIANKQPGYTYAKTKDNTVFFWRPPQLPDWALPKGEKKAEAKADESRPLIQERQPEPKSAPAPRQSAPPGKRFSEVHCPHCGLKSTVRRSKDKKGWYCWKKLEATEKPGQFGCGFQWEDTPVENPFGEAAPLHDMASGGQQGEGDVLIDPIYRWAELILNDNTPPDDAGGTAAENALTKKFTAREMTHEHLSQILKCALDNCTDTTFQKAEHAVNQIMLATNMPDPLKVKFSEWLPLAEDRLSQSNKLPF